MQNGDDADHLMWADTLVDSTQFYDEAKVKAAICERIARAEAGPCSIKRSLAADFDAEYQGQAMMLRGEACEGETLPSSRHLDDGSGAMEAVPASTLEVLVSVGEACRDPAIKPPASNLAVERFGLVTKEGVESLFGQKDKPTHDEHLDGKAALASSGSGQLDFQDRAAEAGPAKQGLEEKDPHGEGLSGMSPCQSWWMMPSPTGTRLHCATRSKPRTSRKVLPKAVAGPGAVVPQPVAVTVPVGARVAEAEVVASLPSQMRRLQHRLHGPSGSLASALPRRSLQ